MTKDEFEHIDYSQLQIKIACTGSDSLPLDAIEEFQGSLKKRSKKDVDKIIRSVVEYGFSFPFFIWNGTGHNLCLDGHGRILALAEMRKRGTDLPVFPVVYVEANDEQEAKQKLLRLNSQYGQMTLDSVMEFANGIELNDDEISLSDGDKIVFDKTKKIEKIENVESDEEIKDKCPHVCKVGDQWSVCGLSMICKDSSGVDDKSDLVFYDPMFDDENIFDKLPEYHENRKLMLFYDLARMGKAVQSAMNKKWPFNYEFILDGCTSWYIPGRPLERHKSCAVFGNDKWNFDKAVYNDGKTRDECVATNERGTYNYKPLEIGKHLSSVERWSTAGNDKIYKYEKPIPWIEAIINGLSEINSIFDPFAGSFTTAIICYKNKIKYTGYEINPEVMDIGLYKINKLCGLNPIRISDGENYIDLIHDTQK